MHGVHPLLPEQHADAQHTEEVQTHHDDRDACDDGEFGRVGTDQRADHAGAGAERYEDGGESADKEERRQHRLAPDPGLRLGIGQSLQRSARKIHEIRRHQRQYAGAQETHQPCEQRGQKGHIGRHPALDAWAGDRAQADHASLAPM
jgi:hypothetical protein